MRTLTLALLALFLPSLALAGTANVNLLQPTQYSDSTPMPAADVASTTVEYGSCSGSAFGTKAGQVVTPNVPSMVSVLNLAPGAYCFRVIVTTIAAKGGLSSAYSNTATGTIPFPAPGAPTIISVTIP